MEEPKDVEALLAEADLAEALVKVNEAAKKYGIPLSALHPLVQRAIEERES